MGFALLVFYLVLTYLRPWEFWKGLAEYRLPFWTGIVGLVVSVLRFAIRGPHSILRSKELFLLLGFFIVLVLSPMLAEGWLSGSIEAFSEFMTAIVGCVLVFLNVDSLGRMRKAGALLCILGVCLAVQGILAYHFDFYSEKLVVKVFTENAAGDRTYYGRVQGLGYLNDANDLAQVLIATIPWLWPVWRPGRRMRNFLLVILPTLTMLYTMFLTHSRGGLISIVFVVLMRMREKLTRFRVVAPIAVAFLVLVALIGSGISGGRSMSTSDESAASRVEAWRAGLQMLRESPIYGVGFMNYSDHFRMHAHNSFVHCFAELGFVGYFLWIGLLLITHSNLAAVSRRERTGPETAELAEWANAIRFSLYAFLSGAFFLSRTYTPTLYIVIALAMSVGVIADTLGEPLPSTPWQSVFVRATSVTFGSIAIIYVIVAASGF